MRALVGVVKLLAIALTVQSGLRVSLSEKCLLRCAIVHSLGARLCTLSGEEALCQQNLKISL